MHNDSSPPGDRLFVDYCDIEANWGPLLFLRPARNARLSALRLLMMSTLLGVAFGMMGNVILLILGRLVHHPYATSPYALPIGLTATYFCVAQLTIAPAWNRRAARLARTPRK
jgi:hypothetical protein